jgi:hypothetical protein
MYGTPAHDSAHETVTIPRAEHARLVAHAEAWRKLCASQHVADLITEWIEWDRRRTARQTSAAISGARDWRLRAGAPTYATLERRRRLTTDAPCGACGATVTLIHPLPDHHAARLPDMTWVRCDACKPTAAQERNAA